MLFYKATAVLADETWANENNDRRIKHERAVLFAQRSEECGDRNSQGVYCFISVVGDVNVTCGIISPVTIDAKKTAGDFFRLLGIPAKAPHISEITLSAMQSLLRAADRNDFISDDVDVFDRFDLNRLCRIEYGENLLAEAADKDALYAAADDHLANETLRPELDRIYGGKSNAKAFGHPVHYLLEADDRDTRKTLCRTLLQALYDNHRIQSRRYCFVDFVPGQDYSKTGYDTLYKTCTEGAMLVRISEKLSADGEDGYVGGESDLIPFLCETMKKYRNQVLTVFCLPRACEKIKQTFYENLGDVGLVEIREDLAAADKAAAYLKTLCRENHIRPDKRLTKDLTVDKRYYPDELRTMFDEWYNEKMRTSVFPQYKQIAVCRKEAVKETDRGSAYDELQSMIGLAEAKAVIGKALNAYKFRRIYKDMGVAQSNASMHMVFTGNPGTAKTSVARLFARIMKDNGVLSKGHLVEVGRSDLVGRFVGWTAQLVKEKFKAAMGGVLFIDEAYALTDDREGLFGDEAINTIVQEMENRREDMVVIFAGYPDKMERFLSRNPGLRSRIAFHVPFADYDVSELCAIAQLMCKTRNLTLSSGTFAKMETLFAAASKQPDFGNGRYVRNVIELAAMNQASRLLALSPEKVTQEMLRTIEEADVDMPIMCEKKAARTVGFAL